MCACKYFVQYFWWKKSSWIEPCTFRDTLYSALGGRGEDKNGRPIESGAINGGWHCSPRFQVKFSRIKNGAIVYRDWPLDFSWCTRFTRKIVSAFLLIHVQSTFYLDNCSLGNSIAGILLEAIQKKNEALYGNHILNIYNNTVYVLVFILWFNLFMKRFSEVREVRLEKSKYF